MIRALLVSAAGLRPHVHVGRIVSAGANYRYLRCRCGARRVTDRLLRLDDSSVAAGWPSPLSGWQPAPPALEVPAQ